MKYVGDAVRKLTEASYEASSGIDKSLASLVKIRASQLNGCAFCLDMHIKEARRDGEADMRLFHLPVWHESPLFTEKEKAALQLTETLTLSIDSGVSDEEYEEVSELFTEKELASLVVTIGIINFWNRPGVAFALEPGSMDKALGLNKVSLN
jgi:AhpD family alkylhydroperoxidase